MGAALQIVLQACQLGRLLPWVGLQPFGNGHILNTHTRADGLARFLQSHRGLLAGHEQPSAIAFGALLRLEQGFEPRLGRCVTRHDKRFKLGHGLASVQLDAAQVAALGVGITQA